MNNWTQKRTDPNCTNQPGTQIVIAQCWMLCLDNTIHSQKGWHWEVGWKWQQQTMQCFIDFKCMWKVTTTLKVHQIGRRISCLQNKTAMVLRNKERGGKLRTKCVLPYSTLLLVLPYVSIVCWFISCIPLLTWNFYWLLMFSASIPSVNWWMLSHVLAIIHAMKEMFMVSVT